MWVSAAPLTLLEQENSILQRWIHSPSTPQGIAQRARMIILASKGMANHAIAQRLSVSRPTVILWRKRFEKKGSEGLLKIEQGRGRKPEITLSAIKQIIHDTLYTTPVDSTHWSLRTLAKKHSVSYFFIKKVWHAHGLKPHLVKTFKLSNDPHFTEKLKDVVGLYLNSPEHALVFSLDEKTQIQALDRTQQPLPLTYNHRKTTTHDYKRNGITSLFAALNILKGEVIGACMKRHRHQEFIKFLNRIDASVEKGLEVHCIVDNYATHKHPKVKSWLNKHPRFHFHFIPTSSSWLNLVERWFGEITRKRIRRGTFSNVDQLVQAIEDYIQINNQNPKPFVWTKSAEEIIKKVNSVKLI